MPRAPRLQLSAPVLIAAAVAAAAAPPAAVAQDRRTFSGTAQVTAVDLVVDVRDAEGRVPANLTPADFEVLEDGVAQPVIAVETFARGAASTAGRTAETAGRRPAAAPAEPAASWRMVVYIDQMLSSSRTIRHACQALAAQAGRLTELGPVEIVVANPQVQRVQPPTHSARLVEQTLERLGRELAGRDELRRLRKRFLDQLQWKGEMEGTGRPFVARDRQGDGPAGAGPGDTDPNAPPSTDADIIRSGSNLQRSTLVRSFVAEEQMLLARQHDVMMAFLASYLEPPPRALLLVNDGYDLDPRDFYLAGLTAGSTLFGEVGSLIRDQGAETANERLAQALAATGWVSVNLAFGGHDAGGSFDAEMTGRGRVAGLLYSSGDSVFDMPSATVFHPLAPLNKMAAYTGGETLTGVGKLPTSLTRLGDRVRLTYQVARPPDGKLHQVEVRARRAGLEVRAPRWSGSPAPEAVAEARARRLLAGDVEHGELPVAAAVALGETLPADAAGGGERWRGTFQARLDLGPIGASLAGQPATALRVTLAVSFPDGAPFIHHERVAGQALAGQDAWTFTMPVTLPQALNKIAVVIEEESTGAWGGAIAGQVSGPLPASLAAAAGGVAGDAPAAGPAGVGVAGGVAQLPADLLPGSKAILLLPPAEEVVAGKVRLESIASDPRVARVDFLLDGEKAASRDRSPFEVRVDFGALPAPRRVEAVAYDAAGTELGRDAMTVNEGMGAFRVSIIEPRSGDRVGSVDVEAEVKVPPDDKVLRLDVYWNGERVAALYEPPFRTRVLIPPEAPVGYLTVQAVKRDGATVEDVVFMNGTGTSERVDVRLVELPTVVTDPEARPVRDLPRRDFRVFEEGVPQELSDFSDAAAAPLTLGVLIDTSGSMYPVLDQVKTAAIDFTVLALRDRDRAFLVDFASRPRLAQPLTGEIGAMVKAVAGLKAAGGSALCDALVFALVEMRQVHGRRALVLLTDGVGRDERVAFDTCMRMVEHSGVPIYAILLAGDDPTAGEGGISSETLARLVDPVGGKLFVAAGAGNLGGAYRSILEELRSQYLLAYYPEATPADEGWRAVAVEVDRPGLEARTIAGYYP
jgi:VWFA-related protein